jgi:hypothetical protein
MSKREPGHIPQTTEGSDLLSLRRPPSRWAVRLWVASAAVALIALALLIGSLAPRRHSALRERPEVHVGNQGLPRIQPGAPAGG